MAIVFIVMFLVSIPIIMYSVWTEDHTCDTQVLMKDGTEYEATRQYHTSTGVTWLRLCNGKEISFPTSDIKTIQEINQ